MKELKTKELTLVHGGNKLPDWVETIHGFANGFLHIK